MTANCCRRCRLNESGCEMPEFHCKDVPCKGDRKCNPCPKFIEVKNGNEKPGEN